MVQIVIHEVKKKRQAKTLVTELLGTEILTVMLLMQAMPVTFFLPLLLIFWVQSSQNDRRKHYCQSTLPCKCLCFVVVELRSHFIGFLVHWLEKSGIDIFIPHSVR